MLHPPRRTVTLGLVILAHLLAAFLVQRALRPPARTRTNEPSIDIFFLNPTPLPPTARQTRPSPAPRPRIATPVPREPDVPKPEESSTAITDWRAQGAEAARALSNRPPAAPRIGHEFAPPPPPPEPSLYGPRNEHPAGTVEQVNGAERHWVTDQCYFDSQRHPEPVPIAGPKLSSLFCKPDPGGGSDVFKHLRPDYLKPPEPPRAK